MYLILILVLLLITPAWAANTINMSTCTGSNDYAKFQAAYNSASNGDIINIPAGTCSWGANSHQIAKTNLTIQGAGVGSTIINSTISGSGIFYVSGSGGDGLRITGIDFRGPGGSDGFVFVAKPNASQRTSNIRLDHNRFYSFGVVTQWGYAENTSGAIPYNCLVDNNNFDSPTYSTNYVWGDCDATNNFPFSLGTADGVYFEDNVIHAENGNMVHFITGRCGMRAVLRYNSFYLYAWDAIDMHDSYEGGGRSNAKRGSWSMEVYNNKFIFQGRNSGAREINFRGGQSVIYNNFSDSKSSGWITLQSYNIQNGICTHDQVICSDGRFNDRVQNTYIWGNKYNCGSDMTNCSGGTALTSVATDGYIMQNTDFWFSQMTGYTAYAYPHPLRGAAANPPPAANAAPAPPSVKSAL